MEDEVGISTSQQVTVRIPSALVKRTGGSRRVTASGRTVREVIDSLGRAYPGVLFDLCYETGELREYVNVFVGGEEVRYLRGLDTEVPEGSTLYILQSVAGGQ
jgi:molybdopterin synthase sulfur carrier subunit